MHNGFSPRGKFFRGLATDVSAAQNSPKEITKLCPALNFKPLIAKAGFIDPHSGAWNYSGKFNIVNDSNGKVIDGGYTVSPQYKAHPVGEILESLCEVANGAQLLLNDAVVIRGGEHILLHATSQKSFAPVVGDTYGGSVLFKISNVPGIISSCSAFVLRLVCLNGATAREDLGGGVMKLHHRRNYDSAAREEVEKLSSSLDLALRSYEEKMEILYSKNTQPGELRQYFEAVLDINLDNYDIETGPPRTYNQLVDAFSGQPGAWHTSKNNEATYATLYNAVTYWIDHMRGRKPESSLFSMIYGDGARLKRKALQLALEMVKENS